MEANLRARIRAGDPDAFGVLFNEHARAVYNLGFRLTANSSAAEEVVSLTFLEAWRKRDQDRARWRVAAALATRHRGERVPQYGQSGPPLPDGDEQASAATPGGD